jgi:3-isopropylmalate/(R)-2-methylmalate dehydratase small subunit
MATYIYGNNIDTDRIIAGKYTKTLNLQDLVDHVLEDLDPDFKNKVKKGDILIAGENFGCGSSREQAPIALKMAGIDYVIAKSFARIFFRNAINIGLTVIQIKEHDIELDNELKIDLTQGLVTNTTKNKEYIIGTMPQVMIDILNEGGLVAYIKKYGGYNATVQNQI